MAETAAAPAPVNAPAATAIAVPLTKVFVGNLSFKITEDQLAKAFEPAGNVLSANIIARGTRSRGYGFVEMATPAEANKAVELMNQKEVEGRPINVEVAKPRDEAAVKERTTTEFRGRRGGRRGGRGGRGRGGRGRGFGGRGGSPSGSQTAGGLQNSGSAPGSTISPAPAGAPTAGAPRGRGRGRGRGSRRGYRRREDGAEGAAPRRERVSKPKSPSPTTLFVANLPFEIGDAALSDIFKDYKPVSAHVVRRRNDRSKGFGFVQFDSESEQQKALAALNGKQVQSRELIVKVALAEEAAAEGEKNEQAEVKDEKKTGSKRSSPEKKKEEAEKPVASA